jgi:hypothetical protein
MSGGTSAFNPGKHTLTEQLGQAVMRKAAATDGAEGAAGAARPGGHAATAVGPKKFIVPRPKQKPGGGVISDPEDHGAADAAPEPHDAGPVQGQGDIGGNAEEVHAAASHGISGTSGLLPHFDAIQASFGHHDVSGIQAHTDANAAAGSRAMGAEAYATGSHVAFASDQPSLHTAAHEAAHVVQQRGGVQLKGGVGQVGDAYEQHADAVAERVVQGKSAGDLLDPYAGGSRGGEVQHKAVQKLVAPQPQPDGEPSAGTPPAGVTAAPAAATHHYEVELKAWIPFAKVVDPEEPARASDWLDTITSIAGAVLDTFPGVNAKLRYEYHSYYRGDGHTDYPGGHRVLSKASFDYNGHTISGFRQIGTYGTSHRDYDYHAWFELSAGIGPLRKTLGTVDIASGSGSESKTASSATSGAMASATGLSLGMSSANPLVMTWAPTIDSEMTGTLDPSGNMAISFTTDLFPSHGIQVTKDGAMIKQQIVNDPSGINPFGPIGAADIGRRLVSHSNSGATTAP